MIGNHRNEWSRRIFVPALAASSALAMAAAAASPAMAQTPLAAAAEGHSNFNPTALNSYALSERRYSLGLRAKF